MRIEMADEARVLVIFQRAQEQLKEVLEMPDQDASRIIRSLKENGWKVSGKLKKNYRNLRMLPGLSALWKRCDQRSRRGAWG